MDSGADPAAGEMTVGAVAAQLGISVRTLHHWDAIGLVAPSERTWAGYRIYSAADVHRLQRVLVFRELGLPLAEIGRILDDPDVDVAAELTAQRTSLLERIAHLQQVVAAVERMMETTMDDKHTTLTAAGRAAILGEGWKPEWEDEARQKWGRTDEWAASERVKNRMSAADWQRVKDETEAIEADLAAACIAGVQPGSPEANALAERHRASLGQWFDTTHAKQVCIARSYTADPRFRAHYDDRAPGLSAWLVAVIGANARTHGADPETATWE